LAARKAKVILACRSEERANEAQSKIIKETGNKDVLVRHLDLFDFESVCRFAEQINRAEKRLDILVNNAGLFGK
jgi:NAD(P)-dependent dehydrogenase (short-subunit alcohol dehydrogenase family)